MESAGKRRRSRTRPVDYTGHENSLINDFLDLRDDELVQTGPKRPRGGQREMWLTPDPLTPLENLSGRRRRPRGAKQSTGKKPLKLSGKKKKGTVKSASPVASGGSSGGEKSLVSDDQASPAGLTPPVLNITPNLQDHTHQSHAYPQASPTVKHTSYDSSPQTDGPETSHSHVQEHEGHKSSPSLQGHANIPPQSPNHKQGVTGNIQLPPHTKEQFVGETPDAVSKRTPSSRTSTGTRRLRSALKDIQTLSSLRRQANRSSRVSFGPFVKVAEYSPDVNVSQSLTYEKENSLIPDETAQDSSSSSEDSIANENLVREESLIPEDATRNKSAPGESLADEDLMQEDSPLSVETIQDKHTSEESFGSVNLREMVKDRSPILDPDHSVDVDLGLLHSSPDDIDVVGNSDDDKADSNVGMENGTDVDVGIGMENGTNMDGGTGIENENISLDPGTAIVDGVEAGEVVAPYEGSEADELEPLSDGDEGEEEEEEGEIEDAPLHLDQPETAVEEERRKTSKTLPRSLVRNLFMMSSKKRVTKDAMDLIAKFSDVYLKQLSGDLAAYTEHAGRRTIELEDAVLLLKRQRILSDNKPFEYLVNHHLPLEYSEELLPCVMAGKDIHPQLHRW